MGIVKILKDFRIKEQLYEKRGSLHDKKTIDTEENHRKRMFDRKEAFS